MTANDPENNLHESFLPNKRQPVLGDGLLSTAALVSIPRVLFLPILVS